MTYPLLHIPFNFHGFFMFWFNLYSSRMARSEAKTTSVFFFLGFPPFLSKNLGFRYLKKPRILCSLHLWVLLDRKPLLGRKPWLGLGGAEVVPERNSCALPELSNSWVMDVNFLPEVPILGWFWPIPYGGVRKGSTNNSSILRGFEINHPYLGVPPVM